MTPGAQIRWTCVTCPRLAAKDLKQETTETLLDDIIPTFSQEKIKRNGEVEKRKVYQYHYTALLRLKKSVPVPLYSASPSHQYHYTALLRFMKYASCFFVTRN